MQQPSLPKATLATVQPYPTNTPSLSQQNPFVLPLGALVFLLLATLTFKLPGYIKNNLRGYPKKWDTLHPSEVHGGYVVLKSKILEDIADRKEISKNTRRELHCFVRYVVNQYESMGLNSYKNDYEKFTSEGYEDYRWGQDETNDCLHFNSVFTSLDNLFKTVINESVRLKKFFLER